MKTWVWVLLGSFVAMVFFALEYRYTHHRHGEPPSEDYLRNAAIARDSSAYLDTTKQIVKKHKKKKKKLALDHDSLGINQSTLVQPLAEPDAKPSYEESISSATKFSPTSVQCSGTTKKGSRCKRMTRDPSGRCYQHQ